MSLFRCPQCGEPTTTMQTRAVDSGNVSRRRICRDGHRATTHEVVLGDPRNPKQRDLLQRVGQLNRFQTRMVLKLVEGLLEP